MEQIKIHILHTGTVIVDEALPFSNVSRNPLAWTGLFRSKKHQVALPVGILIIGQSKFVIYRFNTL